MFRLIPASEASEFRLPDDLFTTSGAILELTVYSLGMLKPTTSPTTAATPHHLSMSFQFLSSLRKSSIKSISSYCSSTYLFSSMSDRYKKRLVSTAIIEARELDALVTEANSPTDILPRSGLAGTTIVQPGSTFAESEPLREAEPFI